MKALSDQQSHTLTDDLNQTVNVLLVESILLCKETMKLRVPYTRRVNSPVKFNPDLNIFYGAQKEIEADPPLPTSD